MAEKDLLVKEGRGEETQNAGKASQVASFGEAREPIKNRYELMTAFKADMCTLNNDGDGRPRQDPELGFGYVSDAAQKRWIRNYVEYVCDGEPGYEILYKEGTNINKKIAEAVLEVNGVSSVDELPKIKKKDKNGTEKPYNPKVKESAAYMCERYADCRMFGAVLSTGLNAGQIKGAVQVAIAKSVSPIRIEDVTLTRMCYAGAETTQPKTIQEYEEAEAEMPDSEKRTFGEKSIVMYGYYVMKATISVADAKRVGFSEKDLSLLCEAILQAFPFNASSSKAGAERVLPLIMFKHVGTQQVGKNEKQRAREAELGCAPAQALFDLLKIKEKDGVEFPNGTEDYDVTFNLSKLPRGVEVGFKDMPFEDFTWGDEIRDEDYERYGLKIV